MSRGTGLFIKNNAISNLGKKAASIQSGLEQALKSEMMSIKREALLNVSGKSLEIRSGRLYKSIEVGMKRKGRKIVGVVMAGGSDVPYARVWESEQMTRIAPKNAKWLTIPTEHALTAAGVLRGPARSFEDTFFLWPKKGSDKAPMIMQKKGKSIVPLFILLKEVWIGNRPYLKPAINKRLPILKRKVKAAVKGNI